jgi:hypothetical protein
VRRAFVHAAVLRMARDADERAPGAAITVALCGHWEHDAPCPLAPHHTAAQRVGDEIRLRTIFAVEPAVQESIRRRIEEALARGHLDRPDGVPARWTLLASGSSALRSDEADHARRLVRS